MSGTNVISNNSNGLPLYDQPSLDLDSILGSVEPSSALGQHVATSAVVLKPLVVPELATTGSSLMEVLFLEDWPENCTTGCQKYIMRCYEMCIDDMHKSRITNLLREKILTAINDSSLATRNWDDEPLPDLGREMDLSVDQLQDTPSFAYPINQVAEGPSCSRSLLKVDFKNRGHNDDSDRSISSESEVECMPPLKVSNTMANSRIQQKKFTGKSKKKIAKTRKEIVDTFKSTTGEVPLYSELLDKRAARFFNSSKKTQFLEYSVGSFDPEGLPIIGLSQDIEKPYLRLTTMPDALEVRPREVLQKSFSQAKERWLQKREYFYTCEQLKSIRQDLTVQNIRDEITVNVYEMHARIALETGDREEFNGCLSQLKLLYDELPYGSRFEFTAYRILYYIYTDKTMDLNTVMMSLTESDHHDSGVQHAIKVLSAWALNNYHRLFQLYRTAPHMSSYLMDWFIPKKRKLAIKSLVIAYRKLLPVSFITQELAFQSVYSCQRYLSQLGLVFADDEKTDIDCKASLHSIYLESEDQAHT